MQVIIELGNPELFHEIKGSDFYLYDSPQLQYEEYERLLTETNNVRINNVDNFLLYTANNLILRYIVSQEENTPKEIKDLPNLNPSTIKIYEQYDNGTIINLSKDNGLIGNNYYNCFMKIIMDQFYKSLNYLPYKKASEN